MFGSNDTKLRKNDSFLSDTSNNKSNPKAVKEMRKEIDQSLGSAAPFLSFQKKNPKKEKHKSKRNAYISGDDDESNRKKRSKREKVESGFDTAATGKTVKKRRRDGDLSEASLKKVKASNA